MKTEVIHQEPKGEDRFPVPLLFIHGSDLAHLEAEESVRAIMDLEFNRTDPHKIHAPLLLIGGESDQMVFDWQIRRTGAVFGIPPHFFPGMGHEMMLEPGWQLVADTIARWLRGLNLS